MEYKLELLFVEDDKADVLAMQGEIDNRIDDFTLIATTNDSRKAVEYILETQPDVVLLDLELTNGRGSGLEVLQKIKAERMERPPYFLVITNNISTVTHQAARSFGADYIMVKTQTNYSPAFALDFLTSVKSAIINRKALTDDGEIERTPTQRARALEHKVYNALTTIGINPKHKGFNYLKDGIILLITQDTDVSLPKLLAPKYKKSEASIERAMENAIRRAWNVQNPEILYKCFTTPIRAKDGAPTLTEFVCFYVNQLKYSY